MKIDEPGSDNHPFCVDLLGTTPGDRSYLDDACPGDCHIGVTLLSPGTVEDGAVTNDEVKTVVHGGLLRCTDARRLRMWRSEEHTSELQSLRHLVCRLL